MSQVEGDKRRLRFEDGVREDEVRCFGVALLLSAFSKHTRGRCLYVDLWGISLVEPHHTCRLQHTLNSA